MNKNINILFLLNMLAKRGAQIQLYNLINNLPNNIKVSVFVFNNQNTYPEFANSKRINFYASKGNKTYNPLKIISLFRCLHKERFDVVVTLGLGASLFLGRLGALIRGIPIIYTTLHQFRRFNTNKDRYFEYPNILLNRFLPKLPGKRIIRFLPVSEKLSIKVRNYLKDYPIKTLNNGISIKDIERLAEYQPKVAIRSIASELKNKPTIIQVGSLDENKNHLFTLKSIAQLKTSFPNIIYLIVGAGKTHNTLKTWVTSQGLQTNVIFAGSLSRMDSLYLINKSGVLVLTSHSEAFPNVLVEAQAISVPVVSFDVGGASEIVENRTTGYIVNEGDRKTFNYCIACLLNDKQLRQKMSIQGKQHALKHFTLDNKINKFLNLINKDMSYLKSVP